MKLTRTERWILSNQLTILAILDPEHGTDYEQSRKIIEDGYEYLYDSCTSYISPEGETFSVKKSRKVLDILDMYRAIYSSLREVDDISDLDVEGLRFHGFDGNNEAEYLVFAEFFCKEFDGGRYPEVVEHLESFNTHYPILESYNRMLEEWEKCENKFHLSKEELLKIQNATIHTKYK